MTSACPPSADRIARALLTYLVTPGDLVLPTLLATMDPTELITRARTGAPLPTPADAIIGDLITPARDRWHRQLTHLPTDGGIAQAAAAGIRLICPGDPEWAPGLNDLTHDRPHALWARGSADLRESCTRPVAVIGTRAATAYGQHITTSIVTGLAPHSITIISGAAYGIDATAHRAALATGTRTIAVLACGPDIPYPRAHADLLNQIATHGLIVSEYPPGRPPRREAFLARNRITAALATAGIIVTEATLRSGTMNTVGHARRLHRPIMAVPGPITSAASVGCHRLIADCAVPCVTSADDVLTRLAY